METEGINYYLVVAVAGVWGLLIWYIKMVRDRDRSRDAAAAKERAEAIAREDAAILRREDREDKALERKEKREDEERAYGRQQDDRKQTELVGAIAGLRNAMSQEIGGIRGELKEVSAIAETAVSGNKQIIERVGRNEKEIEKLRDKIK